MTTSWTVERHSPASYRVEHEQGCAIVVASGDIDLHGAPGFRQALDRAARSSGRIVVDLTDVHFMDSTGLGVVLRARGRGRLPSISLVHPPHMLRKVLDLTSLSELLPVYTSRQDAIDDTEPEHHM
jgi:anti-anti-sigma factor